MKNKIYIIAFLALTLGACKKGDDLYISPTTPLKVTPQTMLTTLEVNTFLNTEGDLARIGAILAQQTAGTSAQYGELQNYDLSEGDYVDHWAALYSGTMQDAKIMMDSYGAQNPYFGGIAKVLMALNLGTATDLWGDVPYTEAFKASSGTFMPKYDSQQDVLNSIQTLLDQAIADLSKDELANAQIPAGDDLIFGGDTEQWIKAAWTLKAKYANRLSLKDPSGSATQVLTYLAKGITSVADNMEAKHSSAGNTQNQWGAYQNQRTGNMVANKVFVDALQSTNDPRLPYYFSKTKAGIYQGAAISDTVIDVNASIINITPTGYFAVSNNYPFLTLQEAKFLEAEAKERLGQDASMALNDAIKASVAYVTSGANDGTSLAIYTQASATKTAIMTEKWKGMFGQLESYNDYRRTGIPVLTPRPQGIGAVRAYTPKRFPTPQNERQGNPVNAKVYELDVPVWWATN